MTTFKAETDEDAFSFDGLDPINAQSVQFDSLLDWNNGQSGKYQDGPSHRDGPNNHAEESDGTQQPFTTALETITILLRKKSKMRKIFFEKPIRALHEALKSGDVDDDLTDGVIVMIDAIRLLGGHAVDLAILLTRSLILMRKYSLIDPHAHVL